MTTTKEITHMSTPYNGTEGYSGTDTSQQRAEDMASTAKHRQSQALRFLRRAGSNGATVDDLKRAAANGVIAPAGFTHHGTASATLSILHREGEIARLVEVRSRCKVYVLHEHVEHRPTERFIGNREKAQITALHEAVDEIDALRYQARPVDRLGLDRAADALRARIARLTVTN